MNIGFVSTRLAGTDGVSLETAKLAAVARRLGHDVFYCAGELDGTVPGLEAPELHFTDAAARSLHDRAFERREAAGTLLPDIRARARQLESPLRHFVRDYAIDFLVVQNAFAIPMQLPLALAITTVCQDHGLPGLAHNHDLYWERERFQGSHIESFLDTVFPPDLPGWRQAVINSLARAELKRRRGLDSVLIPNVFDFETPPPAVDDYSADFRQAIGLAEGDWLILQPTRVIPRKGIELAVELVAQLGDPRAKLVITHQAGDEGLDYLHQLQNQARDAGVDLRYVAGIVGDSRGQTADGRKVYALWDTYAHADLVTYPSLIEGFGNALLETVYFRVPALVNRYDVYAADIGPLGFHFVEIDGVVTDEAAAGVARNYALGLEHYSYRALMDVLAAVLPAA